MTTTTQNPTSPPAPLDGPRLHRPDPDRVMEAIDTRSYCVLATVSPAGRPHAAGVLYELVGERMYVSTIDRSRKARNVAHAGHVGVVVPVRRIPAGGPPSAVQFQAEATILPADDPEIRRLAERGELSSIVGHGELDLPGGSFIRIEVPQRLHTYGLGMSLLELIRDPLGGAGLVERAGTK